MIDTVTDVVCRLRQPRGHEPLPAPHYDYRDGLKVGLAVASMKDHMTNEGWELFRGLGQNGYALCGHDLPNPETNVRRLLNSHNPAVVLMQDKREWDVPPGNFRDSRARFERVEALKDHPDVFKLTVLKDAHQRPDYHRRSADEIACHAWVVYYHPTIVKRVAPYVRERHLIRTYHTIDPNTVPPYSPEGRDGCLLSGAVSSAYPLRTRLANNVRALPKTTLLSHPGYHRNGSATPDFMKTLSRFKVSVCTASLYGYALRKIVESTACGCTVITNLPEDEVMPEIDNNLIRVPSDISVREVADLIERAVRAYDPQRQAHFAAKAVRRYDYHTETARLVGEIERLRASYP